MKRDGGIFPLAALFVLVLGCKSRTATVQIPRPVRVRPAEVLTATSTTRYTANVEPYVRVDLAFKRGGYISEILEVPDGKQGRRKVQDGDVVRKGQVLARILDPDYRVKLTQAKSGLTQAEAAMQQARSDYDRAHSLLGEQAIAQSLHDGARNQYQGTQGAVDMARAMVTEAQLALGDTVMRAPIDGVVLKRLVEVGSLVGPGVGGFVVADMRSVKVVFGVPDSALARFPMGTDVPVHVDAADTHRTGRVSRVSPFADPRSRVFDVEVVIPNEDGRLKAGMIASVSSPVGAPAALPMIPLDAVVRPPGATEGYAVFVYEERDGTAKVRSRIVRLGEVVGGRIQVQDGLRAGERVVVSGAAFAVDGEPVTVVP